MKIHILTSIFIITFLVCGCEKSVPTPPLEKTYSITNTCPDIDVTMGQASQLGFKLTKNAVYAAEGLTCLNKNMSNQTRYLPYIYTSTSDIDLIYNDKGKLYSVNYCFYYHDRDDFQESSAFEVISLFKELYGKPIINGSEYKFVHGPYIIYVKNNDIYDFISISFYDSRIIKD